MRSIERINFYPQVRATGFRHGKITSRNYIHREEGDLPEAFLDGTRAGYHPALQLVQKGRLDARQSTLSFETAMSWLLGMRTTALHLG